MEFGGENEYFLWVVETRKKYFEEIFCLFFYKKRLKKIRPGCLPGTVPVGGAWGGPWDPGVKMSIFLWVVGTASERNISKKYFVFFFTKKRLKKIRPGCPPGGHFRVRPGGGPAGPVPLAQPLTKYFCEIFVKKINVRTALSGGAVDGFEVPPPAVQGGGIIPQDIPAAGWCKIFQRNICRKK